MELSIIQSKIYEIRGYRVMLDFDLAEIYRTETKRLKEAVRRNIKRFPPDFMFELTKSEYDFLRSHFASLVGGRGKYSKYLPFAFEEIFTDQNDINEDTRLQLELINKSLAELQVKNKSLDVLRNPIGFHAIEEIRKNER